MCFVNVGHAPSMGFMDYHWEIFLWGEMAIHPLVEFDLSVPGTWFEYEEEVWMEQAMQLDQITLPEDMRKKSGKHANCSTELFYTQKEMERFEEMRGRDWVPSGMEVNAYNDPNFKER